MKMPRPYLAVPLALTVFLLSGATLFFASSSAQAQCLSQEQCDTLKAQVKEARAEGKALRKQIREKRQEMKAQPHGSPERKALREQARDLRKENRTRRQEMRPVRQQLREGCRNC